MLSLNLSCYRLCENCGISIQLCPSMFLITSSQKIVTFARKITTQNLHTTLKCRET